MQALLLAAGLGTRLKPLTLSQPKCLIEINGIPMLKFWLDKLLNLDLDKIYINVHHFSEMVIKFIAHNYPKENRIEILEEKNLKGTANTIKDLLSISKDSPTLILHSDNYSAIDLTKFINYYAIEPKSPLMLTFNSNNPKFCGVLQIDANGFVTAYEEKPLKPKGNLCNGAIYILPINFSSLLKHKNNYSAIDFSKDILPKYFKMFRTYHIDGFHIDIGTPLGKKLAEQVPLIS